jgi:hypothetical protein
MAELCDDSNEMIKMKIKTISSKLNNEIVKWYIQSGFKKDLEDFHPGFIDENEYIVFMECFEILRENQTEIKNTDELLYNFIIFYYLLVIVEYYVLLYDFNMVNNYNVQKWICLLSIKESKWASDIRRKLLNFNTKNLIHFIF